MKKIYKYPLTTTMLPEAFVILDVQMQEGAFVFWAEVNPTAPLVPFAIAIIPTGERVPPNSRYLKTIQDGSLVWHVYQVPA
jgi:hypothetical protein